MNDIFDSHDQKQHSFTISCENETVFNAGIEKLNEFLKNGYGILNVQKITNKDIQKLVLILYDPDMA